MRDPVEIWLGQVQKACLAGGKLFLATGRLVDEALKGDYHKDLGFDSLETYVDDAYARGKFPCQKREAWERLKVVRGVEVLKVKDSVVLAVAPVKLKDIFSLDAKAHGPAMIELLNDAVTLHMDDVKIRVKAIKSGKSVAELTQAATPVAATPEEAAKKAETAELSKFSFTFTAANAAIVERALSIFGTDKKEALLKMCAEVIASHTTVTAAEPEEAKVMTAGA